MSRIASLLTGVVVVIAALALPAAAPAATVATPGGATSVREFAGAIVFSEFDPATESWHLALRRAGASAVERLPVAPSPRQFDADIGPDSNGRPAIVYQRCTGTFGCDLFVYSLTGATGERPVRNANDPANNDIRPTLWRGRIAWTREYGATRDRRPVVYTKSLTAPRSRPSTRLPGVPQRRCGDVDRVCGTTRDRSVDALELWGDNLAMTVGYSCRGCAGIFQAELRLVDVTDRTARQVAYQVVGLSGQSLIGPSFAAGRLAWYKACLGDPSGCGQGQGGPFRYTLGARRYEKGAAGPVRLHGFADTGTQLYEVTGCSEETQGPFNASCRIETVPPPAYAATRAPLLS
jgi:hypothetical protein